VSIEGILSSGLSSLQTNSAALRVTADNVANVNTPGYARRILNQATLDPGGQLSGVKIADIERVVSSYLDQELRRVSGTSGAADAQSQTMAQLNAALGQPGDGTSIGSALDRVYAALGQAALDPSSLANRLGALSQLDNFSHSISDLAGSISDLRANTDQQIGALTTQANTLIKQIYDLNPKLRGAALSGDHASGYLDERDTLVRQLSNIVGVQAVEQPDGRIFVSTLDGMQLVGDNYTQLTYTPTAGPSFPPITAQTINAQTGQPIGIPRSFDSHAASGQMGGLLQMRDGTLVDIGQELGSLAQSVSLTFNQIHNANSAVPPPASFTGRETGLLSTDSLNFTGATTIGIADSSGTLVHKIAVDFGAGTLSVDGGAPSAIGGTVGSFVTALNTALGANGSASFSDGVLQMSATGGNGLVVTDDPSNASSRGGVGFSQFFGLNDLFRSSGNAITTTGLQAGDTAGFAAGGSITLLLKGPNGERVGETTVPVTGTTIGDMVSALNTAFTGKATFALDANGQLQATPAAAYAGYKLDVGLDTTARGTTGESFSSLFGLGIGESLARARSFTIAPALQNSPQGLALAQSTLTPASALGDTVVAPGDNRGLLALQDALNQSHSFAAAGTLGARNGRFTDYAAAFYQDVASRGNAVDDEKKAQDTRLSVAQQNQSQKEGVNLDEELSKMVTLQQAYNAGARLIQLAQQLSDELMKMVGG
jgi:flagellar hook-associated protein 1 FlgK